MKEEGLGPSGQVTEVASASGQVTFYYDSWLFFRPFIAGPYFLLLRIPFSLFSFEFKAREIWKVLNRACKADKSLNYLGVLEVHSFCFDWYV